MPTRAMVSRKKRAPIRTHPADGVGTAARRRAAYSTFGAF